MVDVGLFDWTLLLGYFMVVFVVLFFYRNTKSQPEYKFYMWGVLIKVMGGQIFALIYMFYYGFGDTFLYALGSNALVESFLTDPESFFQLMAAENGEIPAQLREYERIIPYSRTAEEWFMVKLLTPLNIIALKSYPVLTLFVSLISFYGGWKLFKVFIDIFPERQFWCFAAAFLIPSVFFWGGGVIKDSITLAALNILIYNLYFLLQGKKFKLGKFLIILLTNADNRNKLK